MINIIVIVIIILILGMSIKKIVSEKKSGKKCIGCPMAGKSNCNCSK